MLRGKKTILFEISRLGKFELARAVNLVSFVYIYRYGLTNFLDPHSDKILLDIKLTLITIDISIQ